MLPFFFNLLMLLVELHSAIARFFFAGAEHNPKKHLGKLFTLKPSQTR